LSDILSRGGLGINTAVTYRDYSEPVGCLRSEPAAAIPLNGALRSSDLPGRDPPVAGSDAPSSTWTVCSRHTHTRATELSGSNWDLSVILRQFLINTSAYRPARRTLTRQRWGICRHEANSVVRHDC